MNTYTKAVSRKAWGAEGVYLFTLSNARGMTLTISNYGAAVVSCRVPDRDGHPQDVILGYEDLQGYKTDEYYIGTVVGRYANRIKDAKAIIDGVEYSLTCNRNGFHHHGGTEGFNKKLFAAEFFESTTARGVLLRYTSADGEEGYPGNLVLEVIYTLDDDNNFSVEYHATTDKPTIVNPTQHAYFNLACHTSGNIEDQYMQIFADEWLVPDEAFLPTGEQRKVDHSVYDFREPVRMGDRIDAPEFANGIGYDNTWILAANNGLKHAARAVDRHTGRTLDVYTTEPSVHFYSGNFIGDNLPGKDGAVYGPRSGFCLETQHFPDSPHHPQFPSTVLRPGEKFYSKTIFKFSVQ